MSRYIDTVTVSHTGISLMLMKYVKLSVVTALVIGSKTALGGVTTTYDEQDVHIRNNSKEEVLEITEESPDTKALWYYIHQGNVSLAKKELERLKARHPAWRPERKLLRAIATPPFAEPVKKKGANQRKQEQLFGRISRGGEKYWNKMPAERVQEASDLAFGAKQATLHALMGWVFISRKEYESAIRHFEQMKVIKPEETSADDGIQAALLGLVTQMMHNGDKDGLNALSRQYPQQPVTTYIDTEAWSYYKQELYQDALVWFEFSDNYFAQVMSMEKLGLGQDASELACSHRSVETLHNYCVDSYSLQQSERFDAGQYQASLQAAEKIKEFQGLNQGQLNLYAWAHYHLGHKDESVVLFTQLIQQDPNNKTYANILVSLLDLESQELKQLAEQYILVAEQVEKRKSELALSRKQFDRFYTIKHGSSDEKERQLILEAGASWNIPDTDIAMVNLDTQQYFLGFSGYWSQFNVGARVYYQKLSSDTPAIGEWFGQEQLSESFDGLSDTEENGLGLYAKYQGLRFNTLAELEYQKPSDGFKSSITGKLSAVWFSSEVTVAGALYRERISDSLLSITGMYDDTSQRWGAVKATGLRGVVSYALQPEWAITTELDLASLDGENVLDNNKQKLEISLTRDTDYYSEYLDYMRITPFISGISYDKNLNAYTLGNGGYFSPERFVNLGGRVELLTLEEQRWQVKTKIELSYEDSEPGSIEVLPYSSSSDCVSQEPVKGVAANGRLEGQVLLNPYWELVGSLEVTHSSNYQLSVASIQLRWNFSPKTSVTSDGFISVSPYEEDYAWY